MRGSPMSSSSFSAGTLPLRDAFAVLFFISVGMLFDPAILVRDWGQVIATVLIIVIGKSIAAYFIVRAFRHGHSTALTISASLAQIGEFSFIIAALGQSLRLTSDFLYPVAVAVSLVSAFTTPYLIRVSHKFALFAAVICN